MQITRTKILLPNRCYEGELGAGKTLNMAYDAMEMLRWKIRIISNTPIAFCSKKKMWTKDHQYMYGCPFKGVHYKAEYYPDPDKFFKAVLCFNNGIILVDDALKLFSKDFSTMQKHTFFKIIDSRKERITFWYTVQSFMLCQKILRVVTHEVHQCFKYHAFPILRKLPIYHDGKFQWIDDIVYTERVVHPTYVTRRLSMSKRGSGHMYLKYYRKLYPRQYVPVYWSYETELRVKSHSGIATKPQTNGKPFYSLRPIVNSTESGVDPSSGLKN